MLRHWLVARHEHLATSELANQSDEQISPSAQLFEFDEKVRVRARVRVRG